MLPDSLTLHLILAFAVGSVWVSGVTLVAERYGSAAGGAIGGIPSTSAFALFFIGLNQSANAAVQSTTIFPLSFSFTCAFLAVYTFFAKNGFGVALLAAFLFWLMTSAAIVFSGLNDFTLSLIGCVIVSFLTFYILNVKLKLERKKETATHPGLFQLFWRASFAGLVVVAAVLMSQFGGPVLGGIFSAFPAVFTSTLYVVNKSRGIEFSRSIAKPLMISATLAVIPYSIAVRYIYPYMGIWIGTLASYALISPFAILSWYITRRT